MSSASQKLTGNRTVLEFGGESFPEPLMLIPDPPRKLYVIGDPAALREGLAIIGARKATPYGRNAARMFSGIAAKRGIVIISGGARGCDSYAHQAAIEAGGRTVCILGGGCDQIYPPENRGLFQQIIDNGGAVVSEHEWGFPPQKYTFRTRNRLIAGLARATLIVEAGLPSGTFSTADAALAANKEVLVVPGAINSPNSQGANRLLTEGATPIVDRESFEEALSCFFDIDGLLNPELPISDKQQPGTVSPDGLQYGVDGLNEDEQYLCRALEAASMFLEELMSLEFPSGDCGVPEIAGMIVKLESMGYVERYPDGRFGSAGCKKAG